MISRDENIGRTELIGRESTEEGKGTLYFNLQSV